MRGRVRFCCFVVIVLQIVSWAGVTSRPFSANDGHGVPQPDTDQRTQNQQVTSSSKQGFESIEKSYEGEKKIGSRPPSCENKCLGCKPCEAIQVPTNTGRVGVEYANYEPEGWKCKCGPSFYTP
ncbi:unnamed protein product [Camellia sinensis]